MSVHANRNKDGGITLLTREGVLPLRHSQAAQLVRELLACMDGLTSFRTQQDVESMAAELFAPFDSRKALRP